MEKILLLAQIFSTLFMTGVIWVIQLVQYPFFSYFGGGDFSRYHDDYRFWITPIVMPAMLVEIISAGLLLIYPPDGLDYKLFIAGFALVAAVWLATFFIQIPLHEKLAAGYDAQAALSLVRTNWIRTAAWSLRALLVLYFVWKTMKI